MQFDLLLGFVTVLAWVYHLGMLPAYYMYVNSALHPCGVAKLVPALLGQGWQCHRCRVAGNTVIPREFP